MLVLTQMVPNTIDGVLAGLLTVFTWIIAQMSTVVSLVLDNALLFIPIGFVVAYGLIGLFKRIFS